MQPLDAITTIVVIIGVLQLVRAITQGNSYVPNQTTPARTYLRRRKTRQRGSKRSE